MNEATALVLLWLSANLEEVKTYGYWLLLIIAIGSLYAWATFAFRDD